MAEVTTWMGATQFVKDRSDPASAEDGEDIRRSLDGDGNAYARLVKRYQSAITTQMWRYSRDSRVVEELVQEVFVEVFTSLKSYKAKAPFLHWIRCIATRVGYRYWKVKSREKDRLKRLEEEGHALYPPDNEMPSEAAEYTYTLLERLPASDRIVLTLLYFEGCDTVEIAERMGWTRSLVKVRAFRARKKLLKILEKAGYGRPESA